MFKMKENLNNEIYKSEHILGEITENPELGNQANTIKS